MRFGTFSEQSTPRKILNLLGLAIACLLFLEIFLRLLGFLLSLQILQFENFTSSEQRDTHTTLCIGDSWTVGESSGNYPEGLQQTLMRLSPSSQVRVINLGRGGANSSQGVRLLLDKLTKYHPQFVIVMIGNNDHWNLSNSVYWQFAETEMTTADLAAARMRVFLHSLRVYKLVKILYYKVVGLPTPNEYYYAPDNNVGQEDSFSEMSAIDRDIHRKQLEYNLLQFLELAQLYDFQVVFQTYFHFHGYQVNEVIRDVAGTYHVPLVDNNLLFHQKIPEEHRNGYLIPDGHPNANGYRFIADNVVTVLQEEGLFIGE